MPKIHSETVDIVSQEHSIWKRDKTLKPKEKQTLRLPFQFHPPPSLPPSCYFSGRTFRRSQKHEASVVYHVEVVGVRSGILKKSRYIRHPLAVLPKDESGALVASEIQRLGGGCPLWTRVFERKIRQGLLGRRGTVRMEVSIYFYGLLYVSLRHPLFVGLTTILSPSCHFPISTRSRCSFGFHTSSAL